MMNRRQLVDTGAASGAALLARVSQARAATDGARTGKQRLFPSETVLAGKHLKRA